MLKHLLCSLFLCASALASTAWSQGMLGDSTYYFERREIERDTAFQLEVGGSFDYLKGSELVKDPEAWNEFYLEGKTPIFRRSTLYGFTKRVERFGQEDLDFMVGDYSPVHDDWTLNFEGKFSPTHNTVPIWSIYASPIYKAGKGWVLSAGWRHSEYDQDPGTKPINVFNFTAEKYFMSYRAAYTLYNSQVDLPDFYKKFSHLAQFNYYYGGFQAAPRDWISSDIGIGFSYGLESTEFINPKVQNVALFGVDLSSIFVEGRHWFDRNWAGTWEVRFNDQNYYDRYGARLGVRYRFE